MRLVTIQDIKSKVTKILGNNRFSIDFENYFDVKVNIKQIINNEKLKELNDIKELLPIALNLKIVNNYKKNLNIWKDMKQS
jgi:hypothetical protein